MMDLEEAVMGIIVNAGQSRSLCFEALRQARAGQFSEADALLLQIAAAVEVVLCNGLRLVWGFVRAGIDQDDFQRRVFNDAVVGFGLNNFYCTKETGMQQNGGAYCDSHRRVQ